MRNWFWVNIIRPFTEIRLSYLPPLMVYLAYGVSGITGIVASFYVKEYLGDLDAQFLAGLAFWAGLPWALKMPLGHLVDLMWRWKSWLIIIGAGLMAASLLIMMLLIGDTAMMTAYASVSFWYVLALLLSPIGYVIQDVVADAMTVESVPHVDENGRELSEIERKPMHTTMQALGRVAIMGGGILVSLVNIYLMAGLDKLPPEMKISMYVFVYQLALGIPFVSILGILVAWLVRQRDITRLMGVGHSKEAATTLLERHVERPTINWWILGGGLFFAGFSIVVGLSKIPFGQEVIFVGSMAIVIFLMSKIVRVLTPDARRILLATAIIIFVYRALPGPGAGSTWWMIDVLKFDQQFMSILGLIGSVLGLAGIFVFRRFMAERSIAYIVGFLAVVGTLLSLPVIGMYWGLHEWTSISTGGVVDARFISLVDTALESPLGQVAMIPMLAWIAQSAPEQLKATFFAIMASFTNLALSLSALGTKYLNQIFIVTREVRDPITHAITTSADYSQLGALFVVSTTVGLVLPLFVIWIFAKHARQANQVVCPDKSSS